MTRWLMICLACIGLAQPVEAAARLKGLAALSKELSARIAPEDGPIELDRYMPADGLDDLVGTWSGFGSEHKFRNGMPNAVNMVLLRLVFSGFARSLAKSCDSPQLLLNERFYNALEALCAWPDPEAKSDAVMTNFWLGLAGYDAPQEEYGIWRDFVRRTYGEKSAQEAIESMTLALMLNPYFLLEK